jgi:hypothetical protein
VRHDLAVPVDADLGQVGTDREVSVGARRQPDLGGHRVPPGDADRHVPAGTQAVHAARRPRAGQRRQHVDRAELALQQHFGDARGGAEVPVDLERRVGVPQVRQRARGELVAEQLVRPVAVQQPRPEVDLPGLAPTGTDIGPRVQ